MKTRNHNMKRYSVGVFIPSFCDQDYLRDRDETIFAESAEEAKETFLKWKGGWLKPEERKFVKAEEL